MRQRSKENWEKGEGYEEKKQKRSQNAIRHAAAQDEMRTRGNRTKRRNTLKKKISIFHIICNSFVLVNKNES